MRSEARRLEPLSEAARDVTADRGAKGYLRLEGFFFRFPRPFRALAAFRARLRARSSVVRTARERKESPPTRSTNSFEEKGS